MNRINQVLVWIAVLTATSATIAREPAAKSAADFFDHPAFCAQLIQGTESDADGLSKGYAESLLQAINATDFGEENEAFAKIGAMCAQKIADQHEEAYARTVKDIEKAFGKSSSENQTEDQNDQ